MNKQEALKWCAENVSEWGRDMVTPHGWGKAALGSGVWLVNLLGESCCITTSLSIPMDEWQAARDEYLAKQRSQGGPLNPQWNGEGLPPVGVECEVEIKHRGDWVAATIIHKHSGWLWLELDLGESRKVQFFGAEDGCNFRPIRTDRDKAIDALEAAYYSGLGCTADAVIDQIDPAIIIDALDDGKIPGYGKLEASHD